MDIDGPIAIQPAQQYAATILCCNCGAPIDGTQSAGALCFDCVKLTVDVSEGIQREATLLTCRDCDRWLSPPQQWLVAQPESKEMLALCLRKLRGLNKVRIIDASFIWTEPHSRRVKVKITIQQEAFQNTIIQQSFEVEYIVANQQCPDCAKSFTHNTWRAVVQVRQKVPHKRTFLYLEQLILKHGAHQNTINIKEVHDGIDFYYGQRNHADRFVDFLKSVVPVNVRKSQELISMDIHTSTKSYKFSFSCELIPICKDDLVALPIKLAKSVGNISPLCLCYKVGTFINVLDPSTLQTSEISTNIYWREPFKSLADSQELVEFIVLDIEPLGKHNGRYTLAEATVVRADDMAGGSQEYFVKTHLGAIVHPGDSVMGYHLTNTNFNSELYDALEGNSTYANNLPDVVLVKKLYARKKKNKARTWRVKRMAKEEGEMLPRKQDQDRIERDFEMFLRDVEEDSELRAGLALYKAQQKEQQKMEGIQEAMDEDESSEDEGLHIPMDQLLDEFEDMTMQEDE
ncbi:nonsense-mediated mRNA decay protein 3 [Pseudovirgaria hyperparasitica]|uniref:60S ribosomal export protein NMD3 n=1 Tax=Pseudovirgaria hyperparasitica TaxID=470096 RepID=A0A6A6VVB7_9PEZI|nr:nonsense-mediated mRNA decay protein 3 [Pseudovirgaria hyperparasitica]KAF2754628.1 nonsense-mediated mRNA decay protein 3 [Pseudovirgaria hyperparasitica]